MASPIHFYAFLGDRFIGGEDHVLPSPYTADDTDRLCAYFSSVHGVVVSDIERVADGTWLECVVPQAHDGITGSQDNFNQQAIKVRYTADGLAAWVAGGDARLALDGRVEAITSVGGLQDVDDLPRDGICSAVIMAAHILTDADISASDIVQSDYTSLVMRFISEIRSTSWGEQSPFIVVVPGYQSASMHGSNIKAANALKIRQSWMEAAARIEDVFIIDLDMCEVGPNTSTAPYITANGLVELGEFIADLIEGRRQNEGGVYQGGTQRTTRSRGTGMVRFYTEADAQAYAAELALRLQDAYGFAANEAVQLTPGSNANLISYRPEDPALGGLADPMFGGIHPPLDRVATFREDVIQDPVTGDWLVVIDQSCVRAGERASTRGLGTMPTQRAPEAIADGRVVDAEGTALYRCGAIWDSDGIVAGFTSPSGVTYWNPRATRWWRNATHDPLAAADPAVDGRVWYAPAAAVPAWRTASYFNGEAMWRFTANDIAEIRSQGLLPEGRQMTVGVLFRHFSSTPPSGGRIFLAAGFDSGAGAPGVNGWTIVMKDTTIELTIVYPDTSRTITVSTTPVIDTEYVLWFQIDADDLSNTGLRVDNASADGSALSIVDPMVGNLANDLTLGRVDGSALFGATFDTPWIGYWNRLLTLSEKRFIERELVSRYVFVGPTN